MPPSPNVNQSRLSKPFDKHSCREKRVDDVQRSRCADWQGETRFVRTYQREAMQALDQAVELGKRRFLIELPTGMGKTDLISLELKRLIEAEYAERVLFLVAYLGYQFQWKGLVYPGSQTDGE